MTSHTPPHLTGLILAGGQSRRMGCDKALVTLAGETLLEHVSRRLAPQVQQLLVSADQTLPLSPGWSRLTDPVADGGPLAGILAGLQWLQQHTPEQPWLLSAAVDTPLFSDDLGQRLWRARRAGERIIAASCEGRQHPTCALWHRDLLPELQAYLDSGQRRLLAFIEQQPHRYVPLPASQPGWFCNLNTPQQLRNLEQILASESDKRDN